MFIRPAFIANGIIIIIKSLQASHLAELLSSALITYTFFSTIAIALYFLNKIYFYRGAFLK